MKLHKDLLKHHIPLVIGAMLAVLAMALIEHLAMPKRAIGFSSGNLYVVYGPCMKPAAHTRVYNEDGFYRVTNDDGVVLDPPQNWAREGARVRVITQNRVHLLTVREGGVVEIPPLPDDHACAGENV